MFDLSIHHFSQAGETKILNELIIEGVDVNSPGNYRHTCLHYASSRGHNSHSYIRQCTKQS